MENLQWWHYLAAAWTTTWYLAVMRTWKPIKYLLQDKLPKHPMTRNSFLHWIIYAICINVPLPIIGIPICFSDDYKRRWIFGYVHGILKRNEESKK